MKFLTVFQTLELHQRIITESGGASGVRDFDALESALAQPKMTFAEQELYPTLSTKAAALAYSLCMNHPFVDGNKRVAHAAMEIFLILNGFEIDATVDEQEKVFLDLASGNMKKEKLADWLDRKMIPKSGID